MYANNFEQLNSFFIFTLVGIIISVLFDIFRVLRKTFKTPDTITYIEDILFWIIAGTIILSSIFLFNNGELRLYLFIGMGIGVLIYMLLLSKYFINISVFIISTIKKVINRILHIILKPIKIIYSILKKIIFKPISFICINFKGFILKIIKKSKKIKILNKKLDKKEGI